MGTKRGFTLVELLVVIGIIAVLISILLPTLSAARSYGQRVMCASHLRQVGIAMMMYADENDDYFPFAELSYSPAPGQTVVQSWDDMILKHLGAVTTDEERLATHLPQPLTVMQCPSDQVPRVRTAAYTSSGDLYPRSYALVRAFGLDPLHNRRFRGAGGQLRASYPINWSQATPSLFTKRSWYQDGPEKIIVTERPVRDNVLGGFGGYIDAPVDHWESFDDYYDSKGRTPHGRTWHYLCHDGHVEGKPIYDAILLPPLQKARPQAKQIVVNSNLRQIRTSVMLYVSPHQNYLPGIYPMYGEDYDLEKRAAQ